MADRIPTGRLRRAARTTSALAPGTLKLATSIASSAARDPEKAAELLAKDVAAAPAPAQT
jgi:hypothetical protein